MKDIAIFGAGGLGREIACLIRMINESKDTPEWNLIGFFDDNPSLRGTSNEYGEVLGGMDLLNSWDKPLSLAIAIGNPGTIKKVVANIKNTLVDFPNLFAPGTIFLDKNNIKFGRGNIICVGCSFSCNISVGDFNTFNSFISVGHDASIGNYNSLMPAVRISGEVKIGEENFIGCSAVVLQQLTIGCQTTIGANSTIIRKTKDGCTYIGNPATRVKY
jgi:sugar O-acyltransferase (sialic acid O-acetyltransferase NeuD family)